MTAPSSIDRAHFLHEQRAQAGPDLLPHMLTTFANARVRRGRSGLRRRLRRAQQRAHDRPQRLR